MSYFVHECPYCKNRKRYFKDFRSLKIHVKMVHLREECPVCGFRSKCLQAHIAKQAYNDHDHLLLWGLVKGRVGKYLNKEKAEYAQVYAYSKTLRKSLNIYKCNDEHGKRVLACKSER